MSAIKIKTGHYLNDEYTSVTQNSLWQKLCNYIKNNASKFSNIFYNEATGYIKVLYSSEDQFLNLVKTIDPSTQLVKNLIRTIKVKTKFNYNKKTLELVDDFSSNEIIYSITYNNKLKTKNSLFFDEESVEDYSNNFDVALYNNCNYRLAILIYDVKESILHTNNEIEEKEHINQFNYLCYNIETNKFENETYQDIINLSSYLDLNEFINLQQPIKSRQLTHDDDTVVLYEFSNYRVSISNFKMINKSMKDFINFINLSYNTKSQFIDSLIAKSIKYDVKGV